MKQTKKTQKIIPNLWFDKEAKEAAEFYVRAFPNSKITSLQTLHDTPSGDCDLVSFNLGGYSFMAISAGPYFKINPSISFSVNFETAEEVRSLWDKLLPGGKALMEIGTYPWSKLYGWVNDKYGVSWQIIALGESARGKQLITPALMFTQEKAGQAEEAINFYTSVFKNSKVGSIYRYTTGQEPDKEGTVAHSVFLLEGEEFMALDSAKRHDFKFNEAVSLIVQCGTQEEIDYYWGKLSAVPEAEQCGWLKDKYGVSWQIVPSVLQKMIGSGDKEKVARVTQALLKMKKLDIDALTRAYEGK